MRDLLNSIRDVAEGSIGTCPRCMRAAFVAAFCAGIVSLAATLAGAGGAILILAWSTSAVLSRLWLAHAWMFSRRVAASGSAPTGDSSSGSEPLRRRQFLTLFGRTVAFSALAGLAPRAAIAQATCPCRSPLKCCWYYDRTIYVCAASGANCCTHATSPWSCSSPRPNCNGNGSTSPHCR